MRHIPLSNGGIAVVDNDDYDYVNNWKWVRNNFGYAQRGTNVKREGRQARTTLLMHREIMGAEKGKQLDHINGNPLDNRRANLRFSTQKQNLRNQKVSKRNKTGYKGVSRFGDRYRAVITLNGKNRHLGLFETAQKAATAYNIAAFQYDPEFARLN